MVVTISIILKIQFLQKQISQLHQQYYFLHYLKNSHLYYIYIYTFLVHYHLKFHLKKINHYQNIFFQLHYVFNFSTLQHKHIFFIFISLGVTKLLLTFVDIIMVLELMIILLEFN